MARWLSKLRFSHPRIRFHEDDYCQQEILPLANLDYCKQEIKAIDEFSAAHASRDGMSWTDMHRREDAPDKLAEFGLTLQALDETLGGTLKAFRKVYTDWPGQSQRCKNTAGFGFDVCCMIFADWNQAGVIEHLWTQIVGVKESPKYDEVVDAMQDLGRKFPLLYVDWEWSFVAPLDGTQTLRDYIIQKDELIKSQRASDGCQP